MVRRITCMTRKRESILPRTEINPWPVLDVARDFSLLPTRGDHPRLGRKYGVHGEPSPHARRSTTDGSALHPVPTTLLHTHGDKPSYRLQVDRERRVFSPGAEIIPAHWTRKACQECLLPTQGDHPLGCSMDEVMLESSPHARRSFADRHPRPHQLLVFSTRTEINPLGHCRVYGGWSLLPTHGD